MSIVLNDNVYNIAFDRGWIVVQNQNDVEAFNEHQFLSCVANVYFSDWQGRQDVERPA